MSSMAPQITSLTIVYSAVYSGADKRKHQRSASLVFVRGIHRRPVNSPHRGPVTHKMFPFDNGIMQYLNLDSCNTSTHTFRFDLLILCQFQDGPTVSSDMTLFDISTMAMSHNNTYYSIHNINITKSVSPHKYVMEINTWIHSQTLTLKVMGQVLLGFISDNPLW